MFYVRKMGILVDCVCVSQMQWVHENVYKLWGTVWQSCARGVGVGIRLIQTPVLQKDSVWPILYLYRNRSCFEGLMWERCKNASREECSVSGQHGLWVLVLFLYWLHYYTYFIHRWAITILCSFQFSLELYRWGTVLTVFIHWDPVLACTVCVRILGKWTY